MSHISLYEEHERRDQVLDTPHPRERGRRVKDFYAAASATPLPKNYLTTATPATRRVEDGPDLVAELEEESNAAAISGISFELKRSESKSFRDS